MTLKNIAAVGLLLTTHLTKHSDPTKVTIGTFFTDNTHYQKGAKTIDPKTSLVILSFADSTRQAQVVIKDIDHNEIIDENDKVISVTMSDDGMENTRSMRIYSFNDNADIIRKNIRDGSMSSVSTEDLEELSEVLGFSPVTNKKIAFTQ